MPQLTPKALVRTNAPRTQPCQFPARFLITIQTPVQMCSGASLHSVFFFNISFHCTTSLITDYKYTQVTINGLQEMHPVILLLLSSITTDWVWILIFTRFLDHTQRRTTVGRTPLDEWPARRRDLYLTTHNNHNRQISTPPDVLRIFITLSYLIPSFAVYVTTVLITSGDTNTTITVLKVRKD